MRNLRQAVILAAGTGSRLRGVLDDRPKGFLKLGEKPIIEESIAKLVRSGVTDIVIVNGYRHEYYDALAKKYPFVSTVKNPDFAETGSMYSFFLARERIYGDILLLESDLIYEYNVLQALHNSIYSDSILVSGRTGLGDEVYVGVDGDTIVCLSKDIKKIKHLGGELVGISRISLDLYREMVGHAKDMFDRHPRYDYEDCLTDLCNSRSINYDFIEKPAWMEIDDEDHYKNARDTVYPLIGEKDRAVSIKKNIERTVLLNPGPAATTDSVKYSMVVEDICPREQEFGELVQGIRRDLVKIVHGGKLFEAVLFASDEPLSATRLVNVLEVGSAKQVRECIESLNKAYEVTGRPFRIEQIAGGYQMMTLSCLNGWLKKLLRVRTETKLSPAALETLAIVAYKQPVMRADIEAIRGVASGEMIRGLMYKGLVKIVGRAEVIGRPMLYGTTKKFLDLFGLNTIKDLPKIEELKKPSE